MSLQPDIAPREGQLRLQPLPAPQVLTGEWSRGSEAVIPYGERKNGRAEAAAEGRNLKSDAGVVFFRLKTNMKLTFSISKLIRY